MDIGYKFDEAAKASTNCRNMMCEAMNELGSDLFANGYGIYSNVSAVRYRLHRAKKQIEKAEQLLEQTDWPTESDYDDFE